MSLKIVAGALLCATAWSSVAWAADLAAPAGEQVVQQSADQQWQAVFNTDFRYVEFSGSRAFPSPSNGAFLGAPARGKGSQFYMPFALQVAGLPTPEWKVEGTIRGGYVESHQGTTGFAGTASTPIDTVLSGTVTYLGFTGFQPFLSMNFNLPTGSSVLPGLRGGNARLDPDLVEVPLFGAGYNIGPSIGVNIPLNENLTFTLGAGYTSIGAFNREGPTDFFSGRQLLVRTDPGDSYSFNASVGYTDGAFAATLAAVYSVQSATVTNLQRTYRGGNSFSLTGNASYTFFEVFTPTLTASFTHIEANGVPNTVVAGGPLLLENPDTNSNVYRIGIDALYRFTPQFLAGPTASWLYRDRNAVLVTTAQFVPAKTRWSAGAVAQYAYSDSVSFTARVEHLWTEEAFRPDQIVFGFPLPNSGTSKVAFQGWAVSGGVNIRF